MESIIEILMNRDGISKKEAIQLKNEAKQRIIEGEEPENVLWEVLNLEMDYIFEL